jgi:hypothetical protein
LTRKLWLLNFVLLASAIALGSHVRENWREARRREAMLMSIDPPAAKGPGYQKVALLPPVTAATYLEVADKLLFARDRNSKVELPPPPPPPVEPPKPVMPPLPKAFGYMNWGGAKALLSEKSGASQRAYSPGEKIGDFTLVAVDRKNITFEWNGELVVKTWEELKDSAPAAPAPSTISTANTGGGPVLGGAMGDKPQLLTAEAKPPAPTDNSPKPSGPNPDAAGRAHSCAPGDTATVGAVVSGYKKTERMTPFGKACFWDPVQ